MSYAVASILAKGALFCALNTIYAAVNARTREIATLCALGFEALPVALSVQGRSGTLACGARTVRGAVCLGAL